MAERFNQTLQRSLVKVINANQTDWDEKLDEFLFAYRTSQHQSSKFTPCIAGELNSNQCNM